MIDGPSSPGAIRDGGASVKLTGDASGVVKAANRAEQSLTGLSQKVRGKIGSDISKALVGAFGVLALDRTFDSLADRMREDGTASFRDLGVTFGEALADGLRSVPIAGGLGEALSQSLSQEIAGWAQQMATAGEIIGTIGAAIIRAKTGSDMAGDAVSATAGFGSSVLGGIGDFFGANETERKQKQSRRDAETKAEEERRRTELEERTKEDLARQERDRKLRNGQSIANEIARGTENRTARDAANREMADLLEGLVRTRERFTSGGFGTFSRDFGGFPFQFQSVERTVEKIDDRLQEAVDALRGLEITYGI